MQLIANNFVRKAPIFGLFHLNISSNHKKSSKVFAWLDFFVLLLIIFAIFGYLVLIVTKDSKTLELFHPAFVMHIIGLLTLSVCISCLMTIFFKRKTIQKLLSNGEIEAYLCRVNQLPVINLWQSVLIILTYTIPIIFGLGRLVAELIVATSPFRVIVTWTIGYTVFTGILTSCLSLYMLFIITSIFLLRRMIQRIQVFQLVWKTILGLWRT